MFLLDTNVVSEMRPNKKQPSALVRAWSENQEFDTLYLSALTIFEIEHGILSLERKTPSEGAALRLWFSSVCRAFSHRILPFNDVTARFYAAMPTAPNGAEYDFMIAATAIEHGFTVVTRNTQDFELTGVKLLNPWLRSA